jgi:hypothetical protein
MTELEQFLSARDALLTRRTDWKAAQRDFEWPKLTHFNWARDYFDTIARDNAAPALKIVEETGVTAKLSYDELRQRSNQVGNFLLGLGAQRGDRILLMLGNEVVAYLFDTGADRSALSIRVIEKMGLTSELKKYDGKQLHSANSLVKVLGILRTECLISETIEIQQAEFLVIENLEKVDNILRLDLIRKIQKIKVEYKAVQSIVNEMTAEIVMRKQMLDKSACEDKRNENAVQQPTSILAIMNCKEGNLGKDAEQISHLRIELEELLKKESAKSLKDLKPKAHKDSAFKIRFINPLQEPIACKSRLVPYNLKSKVKKA